MARQLWKTAVEGIDTGSDLFETWIPDGGFEIHRRKTNDGMADCLVPKWGQADAFPSRPCQEQPCLHRLLAECPADRIGDFAGSYGLLSFSMPCHLAGRKLHAAEIFTPEPLALWHEQIRLLRSAGDLSDAIAAQCRRPAPPSRQPDHAKRPDLLQHGRDLLAREGRGTNDRREI